MGESARAADGGMTMQQLRTVWLAMLVSQLAFPLILWTVSDRPSPAPDAVVMGIGAVALMEAALSLAWGRLVARTPAPTRWIIRWAFAEAVTLSGFTLGFLGGPAVASAALMALGFVLIGVQPPREEVPR